MAVGPAIWDTFSRQKGKIKTGETLTTACEFYDRYESDFYSINNWGSMRFASPSPGRAFYPMG